MTIENVRVEICGMTDMVFENHEGVCHIKTLPNFSIVQPIKGKYDIQIDDGDKYTVADGELFIAPPQYVQKITHHMDKKDGMLYARWIFFDLEINDTYSAELLYDFPVIPPKSTTESIKGLLDSLFEASDPCDKMSICYQIAKELLKTATEKKTIYNKQMLNVIEFMKMNYNDKITISDLAKLIHISESNLYASFKKQFNISPIAYLNDYRLAMASKFLKSSNDPIEKISRAVGIDDVRYFSKIFKRKYKMTPTAYRNNIVL